MNDFILTLIKNCFTKLDKNSDNPPKHTLLQLSEDTKMLIVTFLPITMLFSMRRINKQNLKFIDSILEKQCIIYPVECQLSDEIFLEDTDFDVFISNYLNHYNVAWKLSVNASLPLTNLQKAAFFSFYSIKNYSIAKRISLAFLYDSSNIMQVLGVSFTDNPRISFSHEKWVNILNITRLAENYFNNNDPGVAIARLKDIFIMKLSNLGVTYKEFTTIPLLLRDLLIFNSHAVVLDRKEIEFFIDPRNKTIFISPKAIEIINNILKIIPLVKNINGQQGKYLIDIKLSTIAELYKKGSCRAEYLFGWLKNYLETLRIRSPYYHNAVPFTFDSISYMQVPEDFDLVKRILMLDILTNEDILKSKEEGYNLQLLQDKIADIDKISNSNDSRDTAGTSFNVIKFTRDEDGAVIIKIFEDPNKFSAGEVVYNSALVPKQVRNNSRLLFSRF